MNPMLTFGGNKADAIRESKQKHSSQMHEYREALKAAEKDVLATVLFYPVTGYPFGYGEMMPGVWKKID